MSIVIYSILNNKTVNSTFVWLIDRLLLNVEPALFQLYRYSGQEQIQKYMGKICRNDL
jgi:hypothetical protein